MNKKVQCLKQLFDLSGCYADILNFLLDERLISQEEVKELGLSYHKAEYLYKIIKRSIESEKLLLADFEWILLPKERIKLTFVSTKQKIEFSYNW
ncbi:MAG: hypothetical protein HWN81_00320 [Candidatus Lokiarchaeota archaeon]|nr:hypothetical protein [Candidatus Lokiarchaeota archaeon]